MSFGKRLTEMRESKKLSVKEVSEILKCVETNIYRYESDENFPKKEMLQAIQEAFGVNLNWLLTGKGSMFIKQAPSSISAPTVEFTQNISKVSERDFWQIPVVADISAGLAEPAFEYCEDIKIPISKQLVRDIDMCFCFRVSGNSMYPEIHDQDYVIISRKWNEHSIGDNIIAVRTSDGITLKRLLIDNTNKVSILVPINPKFPHIIMDDSCLMLGILVAVIRVYPK